MCTKPPHRKDITQNPLSQDASGMKYRGLIGQIPYIFTMFSNPVTETWHSFGKCHTDTHIGNLSELTITSLASVTLNIIIVSHCTDTIHNTFNDL